VAVGVFYRGTTALVNLQARALIFKLQHLTPINEVS
jgi:hypothetical protein